jgi:hypothetical protein
MVAATLLSNSGIRSQERRERRKSYGQATHDGSSSWRVTWGVIDGINSRSMDLGVLAQYGLPGAALAAAVGLAYSLIKRGFRISFRAEVPRKRPP